MTRPRHSPNGAIMLALNNVRPFQKLPRELLASVEAKASRLSVFSNSNIFFKGDDADRVYVILSGEVVVETVSENGRITSLASLFPGEIFGEMAILDDGQRSADARAVADTLLLVISKSVFLELISNQPAVALELMRDLVGRLRNTDTQIEALNTKSLKSRIANLLLEMSAQHGQILQFTQTEFAERASATREKVNINLQALKAAGALDLRRGIIEITNPKKLRVLAGLDSED